VAAAFSLRIMPTRRTSPRRALTRPTTVAVVGHDTSDVDPGGDSRLLSAAPWIALAALAVAVLAIGFTFLNRPSDQSACRSAAWQAVPDPGDLPADWTLGSTDLNANGMTISILGPASADGQTPQPAVYASVTCYGDVAATAMTENKAAAEAAGAEVTDRASGGGAYDVNNPSTSSTTTIFRVGPLIGQIADGGSASPADLEAITKAVAAAMGDDRAAGAPGAGASDAAVGSDQPLPAGSDEPSASAAFPELEAKLPTDVGGTPLTIQSAGADEIFGSDPNSRALTARIRSMGAQLSDVQVAQAYDDTSQVDLSIVAFRLPGKSGSKLSDAIVDTWLSANVDGVKKSDVTLGGKKLTKIDYGDQGTVEYVYTGDDYVIVIDTSDPAIATEVASKIK
jgi:hypothetical protein